ESRHKGISNGDRKSGHVRTIEFDVVVNQVVMSFRPDEGITPEVVTNIGAEVSGKMITTLVIGAGSDAAGVVGSIEAEIFAANSCHHIAAEFLIELCAINGVKVIKNGTVRGLKQKIGTGCGVHRLMRTPRSFDAETDVVLQNEEPTQAGIEATAYGWKICTIAVRGC